jgi:hypothetical protein
MTSLTAMLSGLAVYALVLKLRPGNELFATAIWLFNPLNFRIFQDLFQNNLINLLGLNLLVFLAYYQTKDPHPYFKKHTRYFKLTPFILAALMFYTHQFALWWLLVATTLLIFRTEHWQPAMLAATALLTAGILSQPFHAWRYTLMLALPTTLALTYAPKKTRALIFVTMATLYLLAPLFFLALHARMGLH